MRYPTIAPVGTLTPHVDSTFLEQIVRVMVIGMSSVTTLASLIASIALTLTDNVFILVHLVNNIREMSYEPLLEEQDLKIVGRWIRT